MSNPPPPPDPNDPWAPPTPSPPSADPYGANPSSPGNPYAQPVAPTAQPTYGGPPSPYVQQGPYAYPAYGTPYSPPYSPYGYSRPTNGKATAALWTGIGSLVLSFCCGAGIVGIVAIVLGVIARGEIRRSNGFQTGEGMALAGIITGVIAVVLGLAVLVLGVVAIATDHSTIHDVGGTQV